MSATVHYLHPPPKEIAHFLRVGTSGHRQLEHLLDAGKLPPDRFVIDAARFQSQMDLIKALQDSGAEIVLDTNAAELSAIGRFSGAMKDAPWAQQDRPLDKLDFAPKTNRSVIEPIARFCVSNQINSVLAPTHFIEGADSDWLRVDAESCIALRNALDRENGQKIAIDYPLITTYALLRDPFFRRFLVAHLSDLPFDNLWLRISGHGVDATPTGIRRYIAATLDFHELNKPVIADHLGGFAALSFVAFGAGSGFCHGNGGKERFNASSWSKPKSNQSGGVGKRVYIPGLDRHISVTEMKSLFDRARTARSILGCSDHKCCGNIETMLKNPEAHQLRQRQLQIQDLTKTPESQRAARFLYEHLGNAERVAKRACKIRTGDENMKNIFEKVRIRLDKMQDVLGNLNGALESFEHPPAAKRRTAILNRNTDQSAET